MAIQSDLMVAINQIAAERGIDPEEILEAIRQAIKTGLRKDYDEEEGALVNVEIDSEDGSIAVYADKKVVSEVTNPATQIDLKEAQALEPKLRVGDHVEVDITPESDLGRVAAQAAKQVILQKLKEAEKDAQIKKLKDRIGDVEVGIVQRVEGDTVIWEVARAIAVMPVEERIPNEYYRSGEKYKVLLKEIRVTPKGKSIIVSRSAPEFLTALFKLEIPELVSEAIEIKSIAREAGQRSKVAVMSNVEGVDPIGACVGQKGVRIIAIMNSLRFGQYEEKIDIILWDEDEKQFVINSLSPAQVLNVEIVDKTNKIIRVVVPDDQLSLAIGKDGQNVRLAAKLTGWNIDIQGETVKVESKIAMTENKEEAEDVESDEVNEEKEPKAKPKAKKATKAKVEKKTTKAKAEKKETKKPAKKTAAKKATTKKTATKKVAAKKTTTKKA